LGGEREAAGRLRMGGSLSFIVGFVGVEGEQLRQKEEKKKETKGGVGR